MLGITAPCQTYSNTRNINSDKMDKNEKIQGKDLYLHGFRILALAQPEVFIAENVPSFLDYKVPTECFTDLKPYDTYIFKADTKDFNLPQNRERLFFVGFKKDFPGEINPSKINYLINNNISKIFEKTIKRFILLNTVKIGLMENIERC